MLLDKYIISNTLYLVVTLRAIECGAYVSGAWVDSSLTYRRLNTEDTDDVSTISLESVLSSKILEIAAEIDLWQKENPLVKLQYLRVLVADCWLPNVNMPWSSALNTNDHVAKEYAVNQLNYAGFDTLSSDVVRFLEHSYGQSTLAIAYPSTLLHALNQFADMLKIQLISVLPLSVAAWHMTQPRRNQVPILGIYCDSLLIVADLNHRNSEVKTRVFSDEDKNYLLSVESEWQRIRFRTNHLANIETLPLLDLSPSNNNPEFSGKTLKVLNAEQKLSSNNISLSLALQSKNLNSSVDAIAQGYHLTPLKWAAMTVLLIFLCFLGAQIWQLNQEAESMDSNIDNIIASAASKPPARDWTKEELEQVKAVNSTIKQLNLPYSSLMVALLPPRDMRVAMLSLDVDANSQSAANSHIKIVAEAKTAGEMGQYVSFLSSRKLFSDVYLVSHEIAEATSEHPYRFSIDMILKDQF